MITPDFEAMDRENDRYQREQRLLKEIHVLNFLKKAHARAEIALDEAVVDANRAQEDLAKQEDEVLRLMEEL